MAIEVWPKAPAPEWMRIVYGYIVSSELAVLVIVIYLSSPQMCAIVQRVQSCAVYH